MIRALSNLWRRVAPLAHRLPLAVLLAALSAPTALAYRALVGLALSPDAPDPPVSVVGVTSSFQDDKIANNLIWDTTVSLRNLSPRPVRTVVLELTMADLQGTVITRVTRPLTLTLGPNGTIDGRVQEVYLAWPGVATAVKLLSVTFADGSRWPAPEPAAAAPAPQSTPAAAIAPRAPVPSAPVSASSLSTP
jgi:hypothetical protein